MSRYATYAEYKAETDLKDTDQENKDTIERLLDTASRNIDRYCNRPDGFEAVTSAAARYYTGSGQPWQWIDECVSVASVEVKDSPSDDEDEYVSWTVGDIGSTTDADCFPASGRPQNPDFNTLPWQFLLIGANSSYATFTEGEFVYRGVTTVRRGVATVKVTAKWGYSTTVPADIKTACIMQSVRWYKRLQSQMSDTLASRDVGTLMYTKSLDPDVERLLREGRYVKPTLGGRW